ncbi:MAG: cyclic nucleotide-binding domain-containing protein [Bacteriovoracaceae bacterium]|nr:cyclic nucleotide-binding domain-containing protein [Bacteriovoracaceae bacterium]
MSYEKDVSKSIKLGEPLPPKLDISIIKYFWQATTFVGSKKERIPKFLRKINVLQNFNDNELRILTQYLHHRSFADNEVIFRQNDLGIGFYFIYSGYVDITMQHMLADLKASQSKKERPKEPDNDEFLILSLEKYDYFGELALLQDNSLRSATVIAKDSCELLGFFKPDMEELIIDHPIVATKLLRAVSVIIANRLYSITKEVKRLKHRLKTLEDSIDENGEDTIEKKSGKKGEKKK